MASLSKLRVSCVQMDAGSDWVLNLKIAQRLALRAVRSGANLVAFPENFSWRGKTKDLRRAALTATPLFLESFRRFAREHKTACLLGSLLERAPDGRFFNTSYLLTPEGGLAAIYRKMHLFDISLAGVKVKESRHIAPGKKPVTGKVFGMPMGMAICYDLRFPELFRELATRGSRIIFLPANFTYTTGKAHWEVLIRARAIENQVFVVAPAQTGVHPDSGICSFGTSLIVDPWGRVLARGSRTASQIVSASLDLKAQLRLSREMPVLKHRRI